MALYLVILCTILAFSLTSTEQYVSSPGSNIDLSLHSVKNASGNWNIMVDTQQYRMKENTHLLSVNVHQETSNDSEQLAHPSLHDTSMSGAVHPTAASTSTANTNTTTPKSCPQSGYQQYPEFNCYKAFPSRGEMKTWSEAREQCIRDGGDLMVIDSKREREHVYVPLYNSVSFYYDPWVGVYIPQDGSDWTTVKGEPARSTWWWPGWPWKDSVYKCARASEIGLLWNDYCEATRPFICEISL